MIKLAFYLCRSFWYPRKYNCLYNSLFRSATNKTPKNRINDLSLQWRHNGHDSVSNHQPHHCLPFIRAQITQNIKALHHWPLCRNSPGSGEFPEQRASNAENVSIWWRHHVWMISANYRRNANPYKIRQKWGKSCRTMTLSLIARFMGPTWGPSRANRTQVGPMLVPWTLLSGVLCSENV